ncbi:VQ motif-containing protein domain-containing protein [Forsythia ovata]|uniref:VQ motif-containing protein domain-containing protein n=1 Tax=Forsythia ovata TaxID=205694 RepID=A0ABD1S7C7_9LAMI
MRRMWSMKKLSRDWRPWRYCRILEWLSLLRFLLRIVELEDGLTSTVDSTHKLAQSLLRNLAAMVDIEHHAISRGWGNGLRSKLKVEHHFMLLLGYVISSPPPPCVSTSPPPVEEVPAIIAVEDHAYQENSLELSFDFSTPSQGSPDSSLNYLLESSHNMDFSSQYGDIESLLMEMDQISYTGDDAMIQQEICVYDYDFSGLI